MSRPSLLLLSWTIVAAIPLAGCASQQVASNNSNCELAGGGILRCAHEWNTDHTYDRACDLISRTDAERALGERAAKPVSTAVFIQGGAPLPEDGATDCEIGALTQPRSGPSKFIMIIVRHTTPRPGDHVEDQIRERDYLVDVRDLPWPGGVAFWGRSPNDDDPYGRLYVATKRALIQVEITGFDDRDVTIAKATALASSLLLKFSSY